jgi:uncharacterized C2H2 Zn-finger protein
MAKRKADSVTDDLWNKAVAEAAVDGTSFLTCPRCREIFNGKQATFRRQHGVSKCSLVARTHSDVAMEVEPGGAAVPAAAGGLRLSSAVV